MLCIYRYTKSSVWHSQENSYATVKISHSNTVWLKTPVAISKDLNCVSTWENSDRLGHDLVHYWEQFVQVWNFQKKYGLLALYMTNQQGKMSRSNLITLQPQPCPWLARFAADPQTLTWQGAWPTNGLEAWPRMEWEESVETVVMCCSVLGVAAESVNHVFRTLFWWTLRVQTIGPAPSVLRISAEHKT